MRLVTLLAAALFTALPVAAAAQPSPPRDAARVTPTTGTGSVSGTVTDDAARPVPVRRAIVTLSGPALTPSRSTVTDDDGNFTIEQLPAGRFTVTVSRAAFVTSTYGAKRPGRPGAPVVLSTGTRLSGLVVKVWRGAAIAGVVRDEEGMPAAGVPVWVTQARASTERIVFTLDNNGTRTDDAGEFRIFGLEPGAYLVSAVPPSLRGAAPTTISEAELDAAFAQLRARGPAAPSAAAGSNSAAPAAPIEVAESRPFAYAPIYYPGTANMSQATPIVLAAGQVVEGIDLPLQRITTAAIGGSVTNADAQPVPQAMVQLVQVPPAGYALDPPLQFTAMTALDGTFRVPSVTPGDYTLVVKAGVGGAPVGFPGGPALWGRSAVSVSGEDVGGIAVRVEPGPALRGRLEFASAALKPPASLAQWRVALIAPAALTRKPGPSATIGITAPPAVNLNADGTFEIPGIPPGEFLFQLTGPGIGPSAWWPRSMMQGDRDLLDRYIEIGVGSPSMNVVVSMSDRHTELSGALRTATGTTASDVFVIAFSADRAMWGAGARRVRAVRPDVNGQFWIADLPPGDYLVTAITDIDADDSRDPALLERLAPTAVKVTIGEGEKKVQDLVLGPG